MIVTLIGIGSDTLLEDFDAAGVEYARKLPESGMDASAGQVLEVLKFSVPAVASIIVAWLSARPSRKLTVTLTDDTTWHAGGKSVAEVEKLLNRAKSILALEMEKPDTREN